MTPIYFPHTHLTRQVAETLGSFFRQIIVYQPSALPIPAEMAPMVDAGNVVIRVPVADSSDKLNQAVKAYHTWAGQHAGTELAFFKTRQGTIPFYDDASVHQIRTDIRRSQQGDIATDQPGTKASDKLMQARLFLQLAQEFDRQNRAIHSSLNSQAEMERDMLQRLQGVDEDDGLQLAGTGAHGADRPRNYMVDERIAAWGTLVCHDADVTGVFVTDSHAAIATVLEEQPASVEIGQFHAPAGDRTGNLEKWRSRFETYLGRLVKADGPIDRPADIAVTAKQAEAGETTLDVYLVPDLNPYVFWAQHALVPVPEAGNGASVDIYRNIVIARIH